MIVSEVSWGNGLETLLPSLRMRRRNLSPLFPSSMGHRYTHLYIPAGFVRMTKDQEEGWEEEEKKKKCGEEEEEEDKQKKKKKKKKRRNRKRIHCGCVE